MLEKATWANPIAHLSIMELDGEEFIGARGSATVPILVINFDLCHN